MRQLIVQVPRGRGARVVDAARDADAVNVMRFEAEAPEGPRDVVVAHVSNRRVEDFLEALEDEKDLHVSFFPGGVLALHPPRDEAAEQVTNVQLTSPLEVFLAGMQSIGSWRGFLGYAAVSGLVVWVALFTNTIFLLVAAMLIAPYGGPAVNTAIGTARGDLRLVGRSLARYLAGLATAIAAAAILTLVMRQEAATQLMVDVARLSSAAALVPVVAGAAGALFLLQSERDSLVSSASVGVLVAVALAPPAGVVGMGSVLRDWGLVQNALFLLVLQFAGINVAATLIFRFFGVNSRGVRYPHGRRAVFAGALAASIVLLGALVAWQFSDPIALQRGSIAQRAMVDVRDAVQESGLARLVDVTARFTHSDTGGADALLVTVYVERAENVTLSKDALAERLGSRIQDRLENAYPGVKPLVDVTVLDPPRRA